MTWQWIGVLFVEMAAIGYLALKLARPSRKGPARPSNAPDVSVSALVRRRRK